MEKKLKKARAHNKKKEVKLSVDDDSAGKQTKKTAKTKEEPSKTTNDK